jgi:hypothetical protein
MNEKKSPTKTEGDAKESATLDEVLTALQKSFSRVSANASDVDPQSARSLIVGNVNFELTIPLTPSGDKLRHKSKGDLNLKLNGVIHQDVRPVHRAESAEGESEPKGSGDTG